MSRTNEMLDESLNIMLQPRPSDYLDMLMLEAFSKRSNVRTTLCEEPLYHEDLFGDEADWIEINPSTAKLNDAVNETFISEEETTDAVGFFQEIENIASTFFSMSAQDEDFSGFDDAVDADLADDDCFECLDQEEPEEAIAETTEDYCTDLEDVTNFFSADAIYGSVDWLYSYVESASIFNVVFYSLDWNSFLTGDTLDFIFYYFWLLTWSVDNYQLIWSDILDQYVKLSLFKLWFNDEWFRAMFSSQEFSLVLLFHPELFYTQISSLYFDVSTAVELAILDTVLVENYYVPAFLFSQFLFLLLVINVFISFYFSFFNSASKEENTVDFDFLIASLTVEAEKEITAIDDILMGSIVIVYIFFWFFYIHCWSLFSILPELGLVFYLFPLLWVIVLGVPVFLLYDFGIFYVTYLRGVGPTPVLFAELMYDYIGILAFFIRLVVQGVRIVLMTLTYVGLHDFIIFHIYDNSILLSTDSLWNLISALKPSDSTVSFYLLGSLPLHFFHWIYELFHTFFVVTAQCTAFFAMAFWLFLFLYSFFVAEKQENYFTEKRQLRQKALNELLSLRK